MSTALLSKIRGRAHWQVTIRPMPYVPKRLPSHGALEQAVQRACVSLRGWDFPHWDTHSAPARGVNYVEQQSEWDAQLEVWRATLSGQLVSITGVGADWRDQSRFRPLQPGEAVCTVVEYEDVVYRVTEAFELGARWVHRMEDCPSVDVSIGLHNAAGRQLTDNSWSRVFWRRRELQVGEWQYRVAIPTADLVARAFDLAVPAVQDLVARFGVDLGPESIRAQQEQFLYRSERA